MASERRFQNGLLASWAVCAIIAHIPLTGQTLDPNTLNPCKPDEPEDPGLARAKAYLAKCAWKALVMGGQRA